VSKNLSGVGKIDDWWIGGSGHYPDWNDHHPVCDDVFAIQEWRRRRSETKQKKPS
jgi:hypothetical protein